jgi:FtsP/CotA-like multicopper oxidase with cupredoxin domain
MRGIRRGLLCAVLAAAAYPAESAAATREYWVAAVPTRWNPVINGQDAIHGARYDAAATIFPTVTYRRYSRGFRAPAPSAEDTASGVGRVPGPLLKARVGDTLKVHFKNLDTLTRSPHSMHFHGVEYKPSSDGSYVPGFSGRDAEVKVGQAVTYTLHAGRDSGGVWSYHDHGPAMEASLKGGMYGALSILRRGEQRPDREFVAFFTALGGFETIDGRAFVGNTPVFKARVGDVVQWDVLSLGDEFHTFHVHGHRWRASSGVTQDTRSVGPAESWSVRWREDAPGTWLYHCHVESHMMQGMIGLYRVSR